MAEFYKADDIAKMLTRLYSGTLAADIISVICTLPVYYFQSPKEKGNNNMDSKTQELQDANKALQEQVTHLTGLLAKTNTEKSNLQKQVCALQKELGEKEELLTAAQQRADEAEDIMCENDCFFYQQAGALDAYKYVLELIFGQPIEYTSEK